MAHYFAILAGGGGTRLWPMSRRERPKQFLPLLPGGETLLGATVRRIAPLAPPERILIVTAASQVAEVRRVLPHLPDENLVVEPIGRNTAPAIGLAAVAALGRDPGALLAVLPSDQHVADEPAFLVAMQQALAAAEGGAVVTIGVRPTRPETGFGYIERRPERAAGPARDVARFVEKPDLAAAERYLASPLYSWNAGMFFFPAARLLDELAALQPEIARILGAIREAPARAAELYPRAPSISIDYAVMEHLPARGGMQVVPGDFGWSDVGSWSALAEILTRDGDGNARLGESVSIDAGDNVLVGDRLIAVVGVRDLVVVTAGDAVLVMPRERAQDARLVVAALEATGRTTYL